MQSSSQASPSFLVKLFPIFGRKNVDWRTEVLAGLTTFITMAYIIAVNPDILGATGMDKGALVTATCLAAAIGCFVMGFVADLPFALASGMGLNAFFAFSVVLQRGIPWEIALTAVFCEGLIFILLTLFKVREAVVNAIPINMKHAVTGGIGVFIAFIGLKGTGLIVANEATLVSLGSINVAIIISFVGLICIAVAAKKGIKGAILIGMAVSTILAWTYAFINPEHASELLIFLPEGIFRFDSISPIAMKMDFSIFSHPEKLASFLVVLVTFLFVDFFDTVGTLVGVSSKVGMLDEKGNVPRVGRALFSDAIATTAGAMLGVSTVTTFVESSAGVNSGGRTGYTALTTGVLFLVAMFFAPIFIAIPGCATAPALIYVGYLMLTSITKIDLDDITEGLPAFITIIAMALTYSIGDGLTIGVLSYVFINLFYNLIAKKEERKPNSWVMLLLSLLFMAKLFFI